MSSVWKSIPENLVESECCDCFRRWRGVIKAQKSWAVGAATWEWKRFCFAASQVYGVVQAERRLHVYNICQNAKLLVCCMLFLQVDLVCPPAHYASVCPSLNSFSNLNKIWYVGRGRWEIHSSLLRIKYTRDLRSFVIRFDFESYVRFPIQDSIRIDGPIRNFWIVRAVNRHS